ncbi:phosphate ABC transporter permease subunit PstC [Heyndrickxia oleronia]|uniref:Phosphate transport system permease protein n=1 Tax=Heyndrickxia oleronia TaxID=38875 RepID=A0A8E2IAN1_9BACI|nr:phosphate ABC transporter permease subunit PstC [Heyndrickxia oleronia]OJH17289.1 phosphate ABC transporter permease subunit PstC [Bacillus obstructivus]MCM3238305.1 phosphate ABC transporter permease subunit PstC [Heyndrickxia oleronia]MCM3454313.1 phosphate ABC transporter permease subunit PstC [Heyndrickxia oleronia]MDH5161339.1 phosphate ABC transporter permease subunit PstC [Heyndrickxia oleronia]MEC1376269.1 phosphate ABC transporter permease subunit PstC [Heyndrickxia oleronia]
MKGESILELKDIKMTEKQWNSSTKIWTEQRGRMITLTSVSIMIIIAVSILYFVASKGFSTFTVNKASIIDFFTGMQWKPSTLDDLGRPIVGALPLIFGSFAVTLLAAIICAPLAIGAAVFMTEISPKFGKKILQPVIELLVGIPSVVYGFVGLSVVVPFLRENIGGSGFGIAAGTIVLTIMILPTITSLSVDAIEAVPMQIREASLALGATRWQTIYRVILKTSLPGLLTAIVFGMARAFGEALAVQMVIGNSTVIPSSLVEPASTLTSILTMGMGYTVMGKAENNALWSLALVLLLMSLIFIIIIRILGRRRVY